MPGNRIGCSANHSTKGSVKFHCYQRVGGLMVNSEAIKAVKFGTA